MKTKLLIAIFSLLSLGAYAQTGEPDFIGEVNYIEKENSFVPLEKQRIVTKTKAGASMFLVGLGKIKTKLNIAGGQSTTRIPSTRNIKFIVRAADNQSDPMAIISIFKFKTSKNARKAEIASVGSFGGASSNKLDYVNFSATKYGESCYLVTIPSIEAGEYGITVSNPNNKDEKQTIVSCFGID